MFSLFQRLVNFKQVHVANQNLKLTQKKLKTTNENQKFEN